MADEKTTDQLARIIRLLQTDGGKSALQAIIDQNNQIIKLLTPAPDNDVAGFIVTNSQPVKQ